MRGPQEIWVGTLGCAAELAELAQQSSGEHRSQRDLRWCCEHRCTVYMYRNSPFLANKRRCKDSHWRKGGHRWPRLPLTSLPGLHTAPLTSHIRRKESLDTFCWNPSRKDFRYNFVGTVRKHRVHPYYCKSLAKPAAAATSHALSVAFVLEALRSGQISISHGTGRVAGSRPHAASHAFGGHGRIWQLHQVW